MEFRLHSEKLLPLAFEHSADWDACPFCHDFRNVFRSHGLGYDRIFDLGLTCGQVVDAGLCLSHPSVSDLCYLSVVSRPFCVMSLDLVILDQLPLLLEVRKDFLFLIPTFSESITLFVKGLKFLLYLVHL